MTPTFYDLLAWFGGIVLLVIVGGIIFAVYQGIKELIERLRYKYRYKHRFDKPPTAECYCIDCKHHNNTTNQCYRFTRENRYTADNWFCWEAEPREMKQEKKK